MSTPSVLAPSSPATEPHVSSWRSDRAFLALLFASALLGIACNFAVMIGYGPDEPRHMNYVRLLLEERQLPRLLPNGKELGDAHTLHPPLYYFLLLPFYALFHPLPGDSEWHVVRLVSLVLCLASLVLLREIALRVFENRAFALLTVAGVGLLPLFGMEAGTINNDSAMLFFVTLFLYLLAVKFPRDESFKSAAILGLVFGLGGATKATALLCDGAALLAYFAVQRGVRGALFSGRTWARFAVVIGVALLVCGWWYGRNVALYGQATPIAEGYAPADLGYLPQASQGRLVQMLHPNFPTLFGVANWGVFYSMWSQKDWIPDAARTPIYVALLMWVALGLLGLLAARKRANDAPHDREESLPARIALWSGGAGLAINWVACIGFALFSHWGWHEGGRYVLPSLGGLSLLLACGYFGFFKARLPLVAGAWCVAMLLLNGVALAHLVFVLNPLYGPGAAR